MAISEKVAELLSSEKKAFAHLAVVLENGTPQCTPVWFDYDGVHIIVNSALGRVKDKAMRRYPHVALAISDPNNPYHYVQIRGEVVDISEEGADNMIDHLSEKYRGTAYAHVKNEVRVTYKILPSSIQSKF